MTPFAWFVVIALVALVVIGIAYVTRPMREADKVRALTRQTIRDMNKAAKPKDRIW